MFFKKSSFIFMKAKGYEANVSMISTCDSDGNNIKSVVLSESSELQDYSYFVEEDSYIMFSYKTIENIFVLIGDNPICKIIEYNNERISEQIKQQEQQVLKV